MTDAPTVPTLIIEGGPLDGAAMELSEGSSLIVGSGRLAHFRVDHPDIELAHIKVTWDLYGISMVDNGSRDGTWVNGEPVETAALLDGDVITFVAPGSKEGVPRVHVRIPEGSVEPPPPPDPEEQPPVPEAAPTAPEPAPPPPAPAKPAPPKPAHPKPAARGRRGQVRGPGLPVKGIALTIVGLGVVAAAGWFGRGLLASKPEIVSVEPGQSAPGLGITLNGTGFDSDAASNTVFFGDRAVPASTVSEGTIRVSVPALPASGPVQVSVETPSGRSNAVAFTVLPPLSATALEPAGALPGDEVVLRGQGLGDEALTITVGGQPATIVESVDDAARFQMPAVEGEPGSTHAVVAMMSGRSTAALDLVLGRLPLVASFHPPRAVAGEILRVSGLGFSPRPEANVVTFDGAPALVARASAEELTVFAPRPVRPQARTLADVVVKAGERTSDPASYPLLRLMSGSYVLRFYPAAGPPGVAPSQAFVATEIAPVLLLAHKDGRAAVASRLLRVSKALNGAVDRARAGEDVRFAPLQLPALGVGLAGGAELLVEVTSQDAAAHAAPPGVPARGAPPAPLELARHWAALLNDYLAVCTGRESPSHVAGLLPESGRAFGQLRSALPWRYGTGVANDRVARVPERLRLRLRDAALRVP